MPPAQKQNPTMFTAAAVGVIAQVHELMSMMFGGLQIYNNLKNPVKFCSCSVK